MRKSLNTSLILTGVCLVLLIWYLAYEKRVKPQNQEAEEKTKQLVTLEKDQIQDLEIDRMLNPPAEGTAPAADFKPQYENVKLHKTGQDWTLSAPVQDSADGPTVSSMLSTLVTAKQDRVVDDKPKDLGPFGLKDPLLRIRIKKDSGSAPQEVWVGNNTPVGFNSYAKTAGSPAVYRIPRSLRTSFDKPMKDLRNKTIVPFSRVEIAQVDITVGKDEFIVKKEENKDEWLLAREGIPADVAEWNKTLTALLDAKAIDFPASGENGLSDFGLNPPRVKVTLYKRDKSKATILLGKVKGKEKNKDHYYAKREDKEVVYELEKDLLEKTERPGTVYRSLQLARFNRYDVQRIKLDSGKALVELVKDGTKWMAPADPKLSIDGTKVDTLLTKLQDIKIDKYLPEKTPKIADGNRSLVVRIFEKKAATTPPPSADKNAKAPPAQAASEEEKVALTFSTPKGKEVVGERSDLPFRFTLKEAEFRALNLSQADFIQKEEKKPEDAKLPDATKADKPADKTKS